MMIFLFFYLLREIWCYYNFDRKLFGKYDLKDRKSILIVEEKKIFGDYWVLMFFNIFIFFVWNKLLKICLNFVFKLIRILVK